MLHKTCTRCGEEKRIEDFKKDSSVKSGRKSCCKACAARNAREWYSSNQDRAKKARKEYREENIEAARARNRDHYRSNTEAYIARARAAYVANPDIAKERIKKWAEENRARVLESKARWRHANAEQLRERARSRYAASPERFAASRLKWQRKNPAKVRAYGAEYRARKINATPKWANQEYIRIWYEVARLEEARTGRKCHVDHIVPLNSPIVCGLHVETNLCVMFAEDNIRKGNRHAA